MHAWVEELADEDEWTAFRWSGRFEARIEDGRPERAIGAPVWRHTTDQLVSLAWGVSAEARPR